jgi:hypothetical protein
MSREALDGRLPPMPDGDDRSTLYLGLRTVHGSTRVLFCRMSGEEGFLRDPLRYRPSTDNTFDWGVDAAHPHADAAIALARALVLDATGGDGGLDPLSPGRPDVEEAALYVYENLVRGLTDDWELRASQVRAWILHRRDSARPPADGADLSEGGGS